MTNEATSPDDAFERYKRASNDHRALQATRGRFDATRQATVERAVAIARVDIALELAVVELAAARDGYLYDQLQRPPTAPAIDETS